MILNGNYIHVRPRIAKYLNYSTFAKTQHLTKGTSKDIKLLGRRIEELRYEKGYSMREFADMCEISKSQVNELGNAGIDFRYSTLLKIADGLNIPVSELLNF